MPRRLLTRAALCLAAAHLMLGVGAAEWQPRPAGRRLQLVKAHAKVSTAGWEPAKRFRFLVDQAEDLAAASGNAEAAVLLLRAGFLMCPNCTYEGFNSTHMGAVFAGEKKEGAAFLAGTALPALRRHLEAAPAGAGAHRVLWAGCTPGTLRYQFQLGGAHVTTVDPAPGAALWGSPRHIQAPLQHVSRRAQPAAFDLAIADNLLGRGIDSRRQLQEALRALHEVVAPQGLLLVGWDRFRTGCCQFEPYFEPAEVEGLPPRTELPGQEQHAFALFRRVQEREHGEAVHGSPRRR